MTQSHRAPGSPPPAETPGPSVTPPAFPQSDAERAEWADATLPDPELLAERTSDPDEALVAEEESAAAAEAARIGGVVPSDADDPAMEPVYQAGGGVAEGFEQAEADLIDNAQHRDGGGDPLRDAPTPEVESDRESVVHGEGDRLISTEVTFDPDADPDEDPGTGPQLGAER